jgi:3alpha(or 20beta)-hydroxysteroid dehydrogenase
MSRFTDKTVVVTGGANGMGVNHVKRFLAEGASVVIADVADGPGSELAEQLGPKAKYIHLDVTSADSWAGLVEQTEAAFGPIDVLVNNAAVGRFQGIVRETEASLRLHLDVNVIGTFLGMSAVIPGMVKRGRGAITNISSTSGLVGAPGGVAYGVSKWAVRGLTKTAAVDLHGTGVRVNDVCPATTRTAMTVDVPDAVFADQPIPRLAEHEEISNVVLFASSDEASFCTGADFVVDGGATAGRNFSFIETANDAVEAIEAQGRGD